MDDPFGNTLVIEMRDLLTQDEIFKQRRPAQAGFERVLVVGDRHALIGGQRLIGIVDADAVQRPNEGIHPFHWLRGAGLRRSVVLGDGASPTSGDGASTVKPLGGLTAFLRPNSPGLFGLTDTAAASFSVAATFFASTSFAGGAAGCDGPLAVLREGAFAVLGVAFGVAPDAAPLWVVFGRTGGLFLEGIGEGLGTPHSRLSPGVYRHHVAARASIRLWSQMHNACSPRPGRVRSPARPRDSQPARPGTTPPVISGSASSSFGF